MHINCSKCTRPMTIDEPNGEAYITEGLIIERDGEGNIVSVDDSNKTIRHELCP